MSLFGGFLDFLDPDRDLERSWQRVKQAEARCFEAIFEEQERQLVDVMAEQGWEESPVVTEGKLEVELEEEERKWWQLW